MKNIQQETLVNGAADNMRKRSVNVTQGKELLIDREPVDDKGLVPSAKQLQKRNLFSLAALYAQGAMGTKVLKKKYEKKAVGRLTAYNVAFKDFLKAPVVKKIDTRNYDGLPGSKIIVKAKDDFRVIAVKVAIRTAGNTLMEEGYAALNPVCRKEWIYTSTKWNDALAGCTITATAFDFPENKGILAVKMGNIAVQGST